MPPEVPVPSTNDAPKGLPPVAPPSGRFIVQLFLVPGLIVAVAVLIILGFKFLVGGGRTTADYLRDLDDPNPEVRWRAASDLAQVIQRPESLSLASDARFGLSLAERLREALTDLKKEEDKAARKLAAGEFKYEEDAWQYLAPRRNYVVFLIACLGNMTVPVGAPLLGETAVSDPDAGKGCEITRLRIALQRRQAVLALAKLGDNRKRFRQLPPAEQKDVVRALEKEAQGTGTRADAAKVALAYLEDKQPPDQRVDRALAECARDDDPILRELVAFALKYWGKTDEVVDTLVKLSGDQGEGTIIDVDKLEQPRDKGK
jgi:hypothetical protein